MLRKIWKLLCGDGVEERIGVKAYHIVGLEHVVGLEPK
jgi:hypothetical protein